MNMLIGFQNSAYTASKPLIMMAVTPSKEALQERLVGKTLYEVPTPSIVLDLAKLKVNCHRMMDAAEKNGIGWRAHIKTHKVSC